MIIPMYFEIATWINTTSRICVREPIIIRIHETKWKKRRNDLVKFASATRCIVYWHWKFTACREDHSLWGHLRPVVYSRAIISPPTKCFFSKTVTTRDRANANTVIILLPVREPLRVNAHAYFKHVCICIMHTGWFRTNVACILNLQMRKKW